MKLNLRDFFWLLLVVAMALGWFLSHRKLADDRESALAESDKNLKLAQKWALDYRRLLGAVVHIKDRMISAESQVKYLKTQLNPVSTQSAAEKPDSSQEQGAGQ